METLQCSHGNLKSLHSHSLFEFSRQISNQLGEGGCPPRLSPGVAALAAPYSYADGPNQDLGKRSANELSFTARTELISGDDWTRVQLYACYEVMQFVENLIDLCALVRGGGIWQFCILTSSEIPSKPLHASWEHFWTVLKSVKSTALSQPRTRKTHADSHAKSETTE